MKKYGIPAEDIFSSRDESFASQLLAATGGRGVDVVLNSVSGELLQRSFQCLAVMGRMIEIGKRDILDDEGLRMRHFEKNVSFSAVNLALLSQDHPEIVKQVVDELMDLVASGKLHEPFPLHIIPASEPETAFRMLQKGRTAGKVVLDFEQASTIEVSSTHSCHRGGTNKSTSMRQQQNRRGLLTPMAAI